MNKPSKIAALFSAAFFILATASFALAAGDGKDFARPTRDEIQKEVSDTNAAIKAKDAKWTAGETSMTRLSKAERRMRLGLKLPPLPKDKRTRAPKLRVGTSSYTTATASPFGTVDWRNNDGNFVTGVRDQGNCGSCWAFGSTAAFESKYLLTNNTPGIDLDLSEQVVLSCSGDGNCANGGALVTDFFVNTGVPVESCYPYSATDGDCANACSNWQQDAYKTTGYTWIVPYGAQQTVDALRDGLYVYGPIAVTYAVYNDFYSYTTGVYKHTSGSLEGYHAVLLIGYDDANSCFIVKNSWGDGWGESGFFRIAYSEVGDACDFGYEALAYGIEAPHEVLSAITYPPDGGAIRTTSCTVTGKAWPNTGYNITQVEVSTDGGTAWHTATGTNNWSYAWSPLPPDGTYTVRSRATDDGGHIEEPGGGVSVTVDTVVPSSGISAPDNGATFTDSLCVVAGAATDAGSGLQKVEVGITPSVGPTKWYLAAGTTSWSFGWPLPLTNGSYKIQSRATDKAGNAETPGTGVVASTLATRPVSSWGYNLYGELGNGTYSDWSTPTEVNGLDGAVSLAGGEIHTAALRYDGTVWTWGYNEYGSLGDGTTADSNTPVQVRGLGGVTSIACGSWHTIALKSDGTVWTWGCNNGGQLGDGHNDWSEHPTPVQVSGLGGVIAIAGGKWHTAAVKSDGTVWAWGWNYNGQLGDGTWGNTGYKHTPVQVSGLGGVVAIACGEAQTIALKSDGTVWAWGFNKYGGLGDGTVEDRYTPVRVSGLSGVTSIASGMWSAAALKSDGTVYAWGYNGYGNIGDGTTTNRLTPVQVSGLSGITAISSGSFHTLALKSDGTVWAWGYNADGELGDGTDTYRSRPVQVSGLSGVVIKAITGGGWHTVALRYSPSSTISTPSDGSTVSGSGYTITGTAWEGGGAGVQKVEVGITSNGGPATWHTATGTTSWSYNWTPPADGGYTIESRATDNDGNIETPCLGVTVTVDKTPPGSTITAPSNGAILTGTTCVISGSATDGTGSGVREVKVGITQTGGATTWYTANGTTSWSYTWTPSANGSYTVQSCATDCSGNTETPGAGVAVTVSNEFMVKTVWGWGSNNHGQLGDGTTTDSHTPVKVNGMSWVTAAACGGDHTVVLKSDGTVWAWGWNYYGQLGDGTKIDRNTPVRVSGLSGVIAVACGSNHTVALKSDGTVYGWGYNGNGQLGDGSTTWRSTPVQVGGLSGVIAVACGGNHTVALKSDGTVYAWGYNGNGQLGDGSTTGRKAPVQVSGLSGVTAIAGGYNHTVALKSNGTVYAWGYNQDGELGNGSVSEMHTPTEVSGLSGVVAISGGHLHTAALKSDGTVWGWGYNGYGQVGDGSYGNNKTTPVQASGLSGVTAIASGGHHTAALDSNGSVYVWGYNAHGEVGDGTTTYRYTPVKVAGLGGIFVGAIACGEYHTVTVRYSPGSTITVPANGTTINGSYTITGTAWGGTGPGLREVDVSITPDGGETAWYPAAGTTSWSYPWTLPVDGSFTIQSRATDNAGNIETPGINVTVLVDKTPPGSAITAPASGAMLTGINYTMTGTATDGSGSGVQKVEVGITPSVGATVWYPAAGTTSWSYPWTLPVDGRYTIQSRATDNAGNVETPGAGMPVVVDKTPPCSVISAPVNNATLTGPGCTITGTASDGTGSAVQYVEISTDNGTTWHKASGTTSWAYNWTLPPSSVGSKTIKSRATDKAGNVETQGAGVIVTVAACGSPELTHYKWNLVMIPNGNDCTFCHIAPGKFLAADYMKKPGFCYSCHNAAGNGHALSLYSSHGQHVMFANATATGRKKPTYGNVTAGERNNMPYKRLLNGYKVTCYTCHNDMKKSDDPGRIWEYTTTPDRYKYYPQNGGWSGYGNLTPKVYRDTSLRTAPAYVKTKKSYLVDPSEYAYNEMSGFIRFRARQASTSYIYLTLDYPYLRAPMQGNALCSDCHTQVTHRDINCLNCHQAHNTGNMKGIRQNVRASNFTTVSVRFLRYTGYNSFVDGDSTHDGICEVCHTQTKYYRRDGSGFANHSCGVNYDRKDCTACHSHYSGFGR